MNHGHVPTRIAGAPIRIAAALLDLAVIAGWAVFAGVVGLALRLLEVGIESAAAWDLFAFVTLVLPVVVTFAVQEASPRQATFGKRRLGLTVTHQGARISMRRSLARSSVKFLPWQMGHTAVFHLVAGSEAIGYVILSILAQLIVVASVLTMTFDRRHRSFHDFIASTQV